MVTVKKFFFKNYLYIARVAGNREEKVSGQNLIRL